MHRKVARDVILITIITKDNIYKMAGGRQMCGVLLGFWWILTVNLVFGEDVHNISICSSNVERSKMSGNESWLLNMDRNNHIEIYLRKMEISGTCSSFLIGPGNNRDLQVGVRINNYDKGKRIRIATNKAFISAREINSADFHLEISCFKHTLPSSNLTQLPTRFTPLDNDITVDSCLDNISNKTLREFLKGNSTLEREFEGRVTQEVLKRFANCWKEDERIETHVVWPIFIRSYGDNPILYHICFRVTVILVSEDCRVSARTLRTIIEGLERISEAGVIFMGTKTEGYAFIAVGILITGLSFVGFFMLWYRQEMTGMICPKRLKRQKKNQELEMPVQVFPAMTENPLLDFSDMALDDSLLHGSDVKNDFWFQKRTSNDDEKTSSGVGNSFSSENGQNGQSSSSNSKNSQFATNFASALAYSTELKQQVKPPFVKTEETGGVHFNPTVVEISIHETSTPAENETYL